LVGPAPRWWWDGALADGRIEESGPIVGGAPVRTKSKPAPAPGFVERVSA
jgi:hypothetical protein